MDSLNYLGLQVQKQAWSSRRNKGLGDLKILDEGKTWLFPRSSYIQLAKRFCTLCDWWWSPFILPCLLACLNMHTFYKPSGAISHPGPWLTPVNAQISPQTSSHILPRIGYPNCRFSLAFDELCKKYLCVIFRLVVRLVDGEREEKDRSGRFRRFHEAY